MLVLLIHYCVVNVNDSLTHFSLTFIFIKTKALFIHMFILIWISKRISPTHLTLLSNHVCVWISCDDTRYILLALLVCLISTQIAVHYYVHNTKFSPHTMRLWQLILLLRYFIDVIPTKSLFLKVLVFMFSENYFHSVVPITIRTQLSKWHVIYV